MPQFSCNGSCEHLNKDLSSDKKLVPCGDYCWFSLEYSGRWKNAVNCDGECRMFGNLPKEAQEIASRKTCNGDCLSADGDEPWFSCATGDQCFSKEEWCNGVSDCRDGTDEASCSQCPEIRKCEYPQHPLANQTSSKGPGYVFCIKSGISQLLMSFKIS